MLVKEYWCQSISWEWILHKFQTQDNSYATLWKALAIPILDYCSQLWSPWTKTDIRNTESVQRTLTHSIAKPPDTVCSFGRPRDGDT